MSASEEEARPRRGVSAEEARVVRVTKQLSSLLSASAFAETAVVVFFAMAGNWRFVFFLALSFMLPLVGAHAAKKRNHKLLIFSGVLNALVSLAYVAVLVWAAVLIAGLCGTSSRCRMDAASGIVIAFAVLVVALRMACTVFLFRAAHAVRALRARDVPLLQQQQQQRTHTQQQQQQEMTTYPILPPRYPVPVPQFYVAQPPQPPPQPPQQQQQQAPPMPPPPATSMPPQAQTGVYAWPTVSAQPQQQQQQQQAYLYPQLVPVPSLPSQQQPRP